MSRLLPPSPAASRGSVIPNQLSGQGVRSAGLIWAAPGSRNALLGAGAVPRGYAPTAAKVRVLHERSPVRRTTAYAAEAATFSYNWISRCSLSVANRVCHGRICPGEHLCQAPLRPCLVIVSHVPPCRQWSVTASPSVRRPIARRGRNAGSLGKSCDSRHDAVHQSIQLHPKIVCSTFVAYAQRPRKPDERQQIFAAVRPEKG